MLPIALISPRSGWFRSMYVAPWSRRVPGARMGMLTSSSSVSQRSRSCASLWSYALMRDSSRSARASAKFCPAMKSGFKSSRYCSGCGFPGIRSRISVPPRPGAGVRIAAALAGPGLARPRCPLDARLVPGVFIPVVVRGLRYGLGVLPLTRPLRVRLLLLVRAGCDCLALRGFVVSLRLALIVGVVFVLSLLGHVLPLRAAALGLPTSAALTARGARSLDLWRVGIAWLALLWRVHLADFELSFFDHTDLPRKAHVLVIPKAR